MKCIFNKDRHSEFTKVLKVIKQMNKYITFHFKENFIYIQSMDDSHVCLLDIVIEKEWFEGYEYEKDKVLTCMIEPLLKIYNSLSNYDELSLYSIDEDKLFIECKENNNNYLYNIHLIDLECDFLETQETDTSLLLQMKSCVFEMLLNKLLLFPNGDFMITYENKLFVETITDEGTIKLETDDYNIMSSEKNDYSGKFSTKFLSYLMKLPFENLFIYLEDKSPLRIKMNNENDNFKLCMFIAPKIDSD